MRRTLLAAVVVSLLAVAPLSARADEPPLPPVAAPRPPAAAPPPPAVGSLDEVSLEIYLEGLKERQRQIGEELRAARRRGDAARAEALREELYTAKRRYTTERDRLTTRETGLLIGGTVALGLGVGSLLASGILGLLYAVSDITGPPDDDLGRAALITLGSGVLLPSAGIPMIIIGAKREPREGPPGPDIVRLDAGLRLQF